MHNSYMYMRYIRVLYNPVIMIYDLFSTIFSKKTHTHTHHGFGDSAFPSIRMLAFQFQNTGFKISMHLTYECRDACIPTIH